MKDKIIGILWFTYSLAFASFLATLEGKVIDNFLLGLLFAQILLGIYCCIIAVFNYFLSFSKFKISIPPPKRFKKKVSPIYKVNYYTDPSWFTVHKWELKWKEIEGDNYCFWIIPFSSLFKVFKYINIGYFEFMYNVKEIEDAGRIYEMKADELRFLEETKNNIKNKEQEIITRLNKVFLENYEK